LSAKHRHENRLASDFLKTQKGEFDLMKTLSVLFTIALLVAANQLAGHLRRVHALPLNHSLDANDNITVIRPLTLTRFPVFQQQQ
jgi:hypothetical protein